MSKKMFQAALVSLSLLFFSMTGVCFADALTQIEQAREYREDGDYEQAEQVYQNIVIEYPDSSEALEAQKHLVLMYISGEVNGNVQESFNKLVDDFSQNPGFPRALYQIARSYEKTEKNQEAKDIYHGIVSDYPGTKDAIKSQRNLVLLHIRLSEDAEAQGAIDKLMEDFDGDYRLPPSIYTIAETYEELEQYEKSKSVYQQVINLYPERRCARKALLDISKIEVLSLIESGKDAEAEVAINNLVRDFSGKSHLPNVICRIADEYYFKACQLESEGLGDQAKEQFQRAINTFEIIINELGRSRRVPQALCCMGYCYRRLGEYEKSNQCYKTVVNDWPDYKDAWSALFMVGINFEDLAQSKLVSKSQAEAEIKAAYQQLLEKYPVCPMAENAEFWLANHDSE